MTGNKIILAALEAFKQSFAALLNNNNPSVIEHTLKSKKKFYMHHGPDPVYFFSQTDTQHDNSTN